MGRTGPYAAIVSTGSIIEAPVAVVSVTGGASGHRVGLRRGRDFRVLSCS